MAVEDIVALVSDKGAAIFSWSEDDFGAQVGEIGGLGAPTEGDHFDRDMPLGAQKGRKLGFVDDDHLTLAGLGDNFFA